MTKKVLVPIDINNPNIALVCNEGALAIRFHRNYTNLLPLFRSAARSLPAGARKLQRSLRDDFKEWKTAL